MLTSSSSSTGANKRKKLERWEGYLVSGTSGTIAGSLASLVSREFVVFFQSRCLLRSASGCFV